MIDTEAMRKMAERKRPNYDEVLDLLNDLREVRDDAETVVDVDVDGPLSDLSDMLDTLTALQTNYGIGATYDTLLILRSAIEDLQNELPDTDDLQTVVENYDEAQQACETAIDLKESARGEYSTEDKDDAREHLSETLIALADALDSVAVKPIPVTSSI